MRLFKCLVRGENFPGTFVEETQLVGFYTTRWVEADSAEAAEQIGLGMLQDEFQFSDEARRMTPDAKVYFEEVVEVSLDTPRIPPNSGAAWYPMDENK